MRRQVELGNEAAAALAGTHDAVLEALREQLDAKLTLRGDVVTLDGEPEDVDAAADLIEEIAARARQGHDIDPGTVRSVTSALDADESPGAVLDDVVWHNRQLRVAPRTVNQKRYVDAIRNNTVTFGVGPAGTGKTWLAVAMAAAALSRREVNRIILTRPAVEAGERLGFLPGDLMAKVDPYLRPLFDALHDMLGPEKVQAALERQQIEVAPLAFMRGRAQPVDAAVMTPDGERAIGSLRVGDLVTGSDGRPTPVLGVFAQGRRPVFRVKAQDGASTVCCAEHLWFVTTPDDREHGKAGRVVRTDDMVGQLRCDHQRRFELPLVSAPVELEPQDVPMDPYALGLLLGDGCLTLTTTPAFSTKDVELADALEGALDRIELRHTGGFEYVLRHVDGHRGGVIVHNPVTVAFGELGLAGTRSATKFVPKAYLRNASSVRLAVLQGLLDTDGGPVGQAGPTCRVQYTTCSSQLRDDVVFLVRSLGGVAYWRTLAAAGRKPGGTKERPVHCRSDTYVVDIRLPSGVEPFRLARKRDRYAETGGSRPVRFVDSIEPAGEEETVCISVGAQDSLYVTDDLLLTHNTLNDSFIILDEAQNTTPEQMKMFLTRLGFGSRMVVTGDVTQIDLPANQRSGLLVVTEILRDVDDIAKIRFGASDVVRHRLVQRIVEAYERDAEGSPAPSELRPRST